MNCQSSGFSDISITSESRSLRRIHAEIVGYLLNTEMLGFISFVRVRLATIIFELRDKSFQALCIATMLQTRIINTNIERPPACTLGQRRTKTIRCAILSKEKSMMKLGGRWENLRHRRRGHLDQSVVEAHTSPIAFKWRFTVWPPLQSHLRIKAFGR